MNETLTQKLHTGIASIDESLDGYRKGTLNGLVAKAGDGKTSALIEIANLVQSQAHDVLFFTLEETPENIERRLVQYETIPVSRVYVRALDPRVMVTDIRTIIESEYSNRFHTHRYNLPLIIVDNIQLLGSYMPGSSETAHELKSIAQDTGSVILVSDQLHRSLVENQDLHVVTSRYVYDTIVRVEKDTYTVIKNDFA